ncbi:glycerate kinase [Escherichia coli]
MLQALESGATNIIIGIGGSATNDWPAQAWYRRWGGMDDANGNEIWFWRWYSPYTRMISIFPASIRA